MEIVRFGRTGLQVSRVAFGGIPIQRLTECEAVRVVSRALDLGITFIDTANGYTTSEERIGQAIAGRRAGVVLATKCGARDRVMALEHLHLSLKRLGTDVIDLWQFHGVSSAEDYDQVLGPGGAMEAAHDALRDGKILHIGLTSHALATALTATASDLFASIQFPFNFVATEPADALVALAQQHDVGFIAMKPFGGGMLGNAPVAIKYLLQFPGVVPDPGFETVDEIEEVVRIAEGPLRLTEGDVQAMERIRSEVEARFCHRCQYCEPCPNEIPIPLILNLRSFYRRFPRESFFGGGVADGVAKARECQECGECETRCPYHLPIRAMLVENVGFFDSLSG
jgi:uncharacterized protein